MNYDPQTECKVFLAVKELGEGTTEEIYEYITKQEQLKIERDVMLRYLRRWKAKKIMAANYHDDKILWKLADIPPWYASGIMAIVKGTVSVDMRTAIDALNERLKTQGRIIEPTGVWGDFKRFELTFETVDPILGGWQSKNDGELMIPTVGKERFIPSNWFKGWIGSNCGIAELPGSVRFHVGVSNAELPHNLTPETYRLKVRTGLCTYEAIPRKTRFKTIWTLPMRGSKLQTPEQWQKFIEEACAYPLRGIGANPFALGGRLKLISLKTPEVIKA